jgi:ABC-type branched-subunit amino acid transport system ATPase component
MISSPCFHACPTGSGKGAGTLSGGEKKILSFCRALAEDTRLVILDEPTEGVQPENIALMAEAINLAKDAGRGFLIVEQNLSLVEAVADQAALMDHGECIYTHSGTGQSSRGTVAAAADLNRDWQNEKPAPSERTRPVSFPLR